MKRWTRARQASWCGSCADVIEAGAPMLLIETTGGRSFRRCEACAGPANAEQLAADDAQAREPEGRAIDGAARTRDGKQAATGDV